MSTPSVSQVEFAAYDAMKEVASSLKAAFPNRAVKATTDVDEQWWIRRAWLVDDAVAAVVNTDLEATRSAAEGLAHRLRERASNPEAA
ncbi:hypothetical protein [uncultured Corynebacterium sp.]|uniref:hypothetical protein n=1 Tax=uncultured Corynebacterium sp. TaxID=159447 RepID=UPI0025FCF559|nr:hypothetical protein [uncultured Corynebacterium sp.]